MQFSQLISVADEGKWENILSQCGSYDAYHLFGYHKVAFNQNEGTPFLFVHCKDFKYAALPFLLREVSEVQGISPCIFRDVTSVYGYPGVVSSISCHDEGAEEFRFSFQKALLEVLLSVQTVSFFSRLNPLIDSSWLLQGLADIVPLSETVVVDLMQTEAEQIKGMTKGHLCDIRRARNTGTQVEIDHEWRYLDEFVSIYNMTMDRNGASDYYYFSKEYFLNLKQELGSTLKLVVAKLDEDIISASMFLCSDRIIQYHLSGTATPYLQYAGAKIILDEMRRWGKENGFSWLHLGGGVGSQHDQLFRFKAGFSKNRPLFKIARAILQPDIYNALVNEREQWLKCNEYCMGEGDYFPKYRQPFSKY